MTPLLILGAGEAAFDLADMVHDLAEFSVAAFVQNADPAKRFPTALGLPVLYVDEIRDLAATHYAVCCTSLENRAAFVEQAAAAGFRFATLVHPKAHVPSSARLGEGTTVAPGAIVGAHAVIGRHVRINRGALIGHHSEIGDYSIVGPGANIAGDVRIGQATLVGIGAIVSDRLRIGARCFLTAGAVVTANVPDGSKVVTAITRTIPHT